MVDNMIGVRENDLEVQLSSQSTGRKFRALVDVHQLCELLEVDYHKNIVYLLYRLNEEKRYHEFSIQKKSGGFRIIRAPSTSIRIIQRKLAAILLEEFSLKRSVHGFAKGRSITTNAEKHVRKKSILNIDLENFFGSINFGRVRGMFLAEPYRFPPPVATVLAQICCHKNELPQGAPTSPIISNMICSVLDKKLQDLAHRHKCQYTRYADDITISSSRARLPKEIVELIDQDGANVVELGPALVHIIESNGFRVNSRKTRFLPPSRRQEVTGLVVNRFVNVKRVYIRNISSALHAWDKYGLHALQNRYASDYATKHRFLGKETPPIVQVLYGRIQHVGSVRGWDDSVYVKLRDKFNALSPFKIKKNVLTPAEKISLGCWIIESDEETVQGTAFFLDGFGIVTNAHCVGSKPFIYHPSNPTNNIYVSVTAINNDIDLAILRPFTTEVNWASLSPQAFQSEVQYHDQCELLGYPEHAPGKTLSRRAGEVTGFTMKSGIRRFNISPPIIHGNSGGPVLNRALRVIGIAVTGTSSSQELSDVTERGVIPVSALRYLS